jgi:hypothetical protein
MISNVSQFEESCDVRAVAERQVVEQFERGIVPDGKFHHADHLRLAFAYLKCFPLLEVLEKFPSALKRFAEAHGKANLYHETITWAFLFLIRERMIRKDVAQPWPEFVSENQDLLIWKGGLIERLYQQETLASPVARSIFVLPNCGSSTSP